ncbi:hypothetical protein [Nocardia sp. NPDC127526]|uniref:hypothetical protein n=1 Tax=Nocardia sp. NPDC127526 TaxID=3345393 RepID=UPI00363252B8
MTAHPTALGGRPINGTISRRGPGAQRPIEELIAAIDAVFAFPEVQKVKWHQYTPGWNDGEPCEFSADEPSFLIEGVIPTVEPDDYFDEDDEDDDSIRFVSAWDIKYGNVLGPEKYGEPVKYPHLSAELVTAIDALETAITSTGHQTALQTHFGDPSEITATRDGFNVAASDFY